MKARVLARVHASRDQFIWPTFPFICRELTNPLFDSPTYRNSPKRFIRMFACGILQPDPPPRERIRTF